MTNASSKITIEAPADAIWQVVSDFSAACRYFVMVERCTVDGTGVGATRKLTSVDGSTIDERLELLDHAAGQIRYSLLTDTPFRNCQTSVSVQDLGQRRGEVTWSATFFADGLPPDEAQEMMVGALAGSCQALKQYLER